MAVEGFEQGGVGARQFVGLCEILATPVKSLLNPIRHRVAGAVHQLPSIKASVRSRMD